MWDQIRDGGLVTAVAGPERKALIDRLQATMALIEGHAEHVMDAAGAPVLPNVAKLREAMDHRRKHRPPLFKLLERLLGLDMKMRQYEHGKRFCDAVVARGGDRCAQPRVVRARPAADARGARRPGGVDPPDRAARGDAAGLMLRTLLAFVPVAVLVTITPGPATAMVVRSAAAGGRRSALACTAGNSLGVLASGALAARASPPPSRRRSPSSPS